MLESCRKDLQIAPILRAKLTDWLSSPYRKPLVIRGARQVGKSTLVRQFAESQGLVLHEVNLERHPTLANLFKTTTSRQSFKNWNTSAAGDRWTPPSVCCSWMRYNLYPLPWPPCDTSMKTAHSCQ